MHDARVLIVDDEQGILKLCERLLERANFDVESTTDPAEGVSFLKKEQFDLLLVDIRMPGIDGFEVIEIAKKHQSEIAVVIMTGYGTLETAIKALKRGADGLILKPFETTAELVTTVKDALEERKRKREMARLRAIRPLLDMTESLFSETRHEALFDLIINGITGNMRCEHAGIYRKDNGDAFLRLIASQGNTLPEGHSRAKSGIIGRTDHWQVPIWVNRIGPGEADLQATLAEQGLDSVLCTPVGRDGRGLVFYAARSEGSPVFQLGDLELFNILARQADAALENARLYEELRDYVRQIEASQRALIQAEKMAAVGRLTASIAHEVNNPLQAMQNCLHLSGREELSSEKRENYRLMAEEELERLKSTVQRMLDFYRPGAIDRVPTDINELIDKTLALLEKQLLETNINVQLDYNKDLPSVIVVSNQLQQVFFNLILNAMDAMPDGGKLSIQTRANREQLEIIFQDTGVGIPRKERENIFEPFVSSKEDGSGLGLSVSYGILTAHGGGLELLSDVKKGTAFRIVLPIKEAK